LTTRFSNKSDKVDRPHQLYFMRENGAFPPNTDLIETLDFISSAVR
jgi:hypothetical protein